MRSRSYGSYGAYGYGYAGAADPMLGGASGLARPARRRAWELTGPVLWIGLLGAVSMFGMLQRPPVIPVNMTYLLFGIVVLTFLGAVLGSRGGLHFTWTRSDAWVVVLLGAGLLSSVLATWFYQMPLSVFEGERVTYLGVLVLYFMTRLVVRQRDHIYFVIGILLAGMFVQSLLGVALYFAAPKLPAITVINRHGEDEDLDVVEAKSFGDAARLSGFSGNPNTFVSMPLMALPLAIGLLVTGASARYRAWLTFTAALGALGVMLAFSRSAWIGTFIGLASLLRLGPFLPRLKGTRSLALAGLVLAVVGGATLLKHADAISTRYSSIDDRQSLGARPEMWQHALDMLLAYPTGVGLGNYKEASRRTFSDKLAGRSAHNSLVGVTAEGGILAGLAMLCFFWERFRIGLPPYRSLRDRALLIGLSAGFLAFAVHMCFHTVHSQIYVWVLAACQTSLRQLPPESEAFST
jgi:O-Antigen ligase